MKIYEYQQSASEFRFTTAAGTNYEINFDFEVGQLFVETTPFKHYTNDVYWLDIECSIENAPFDPVAGNTIC